MNSSFTTGPSTGFSARGATDYLQSLQDISFQWESRHPDLFPINPSCHIQLSAARIVLGLHNYQKAIDWLTSKKNKPDFIPADDVEPVLKQIIQWRDFPDFVLFSEYKQPSDYTKFIQFKEKYCGSSPNADFLSKFSEEARNYCKRIVFNHELSFYEVVDAIVAMRKAAVLPGDWPTDPMLQQMAKTLIERTVRQPTERSVEDVAHRFSQFIESMQNPANVIREIFTDERLDTELKTSLNKLLEPLLEKISEYETK